MTAIAFQFERSRMEQPRKFERRAWSHDVIHPGNDDKDICFDRPRRPVHRPIESLGHVQSHHGLCLPDLVVTIESGIAFFFSQPVEKLFARNLPVVMVRRREQQFAKFKLDHA